MFKTVMLKNFAATVLILASSFCPAEARTFKEQFPDVTVKSAEERTFLEALDYRQGEVPLGAGGVKLNIPQKFYYIGGEQARRILTEAWSNPPAAAKNVLGIVFPANATPVDGSWGAIITFDEDGYVSDADAQKFDYAALLKDMQEGTAASNEERTKAGFPAVRLVGWASQPFYDAAEHKLHWAKEIEFGGSPEHTVNYDVRALGRRGVLKINFVAGMEQLAEIKSVIPAVMAMPEFEAGSRYADYIPGTDKVAAYGIGGLIAGKVLAKAGMFVFLLALLKKGGFLVVLLLAPLFGFVKRLFSRGSGPKA